MTASPDSPHHWRQHGQMTTLVAWVSTCLRHISATAYHHKWQFHMIDPQVYIGRCIFIVHKRRLLEGWGWSHKFGVGLSDSLCKCYIITVELSILVKSLQKIGTVAYFLTTLHNSSKSHVKCQSRWHLQSPQYIQKHYTKWQNKNIT